MNKMVLNAFRPRPAALSKDIQHEKPNRLYNNREESSPDAAASAWVPRMMTLALLKWGQSGIFGISFTVILDAKWSQSPISLSAGSS
jgi:hypothetical protein